MSRSALTGVLALAITVAAPAAAEWIPLTDDTTPFDVRVLESTEDRILIDVRLSGFERHPVEIAGETWYQIDLGSESRANPIGAPDVPDIRRSLWIPDDAHMSVRVLGLEWTDVPLTPVAPSKGAITRDTDPASVPWTFGEAYETDRLHPEERVRLGEPYILRDFRGAVLEVEPFAYDPATQTLRVYTHLEIEVIPDGPGLVNVIDRGTAPASVHAEFAQIYGTHFLNHEALGTLARYTPVSEAGRMLVITYDAFHEAVQPLVDWKNQRGIRCDVVDVSTIGSTATQIRSYIQQAYDGPGVAYVLLVGDVQQIPSLYVLEGASDPSYVLLAGSDSYPDALIGRISAQTVSEVETQVERIVGYEANPPGIDWYHRGMGVGSNEGPGDDGEFDYQHLNRIRDDLLAWNYTEVDQIYDPTATTSQISNALNNGRSVINYTGHGSTTSWGTTGFSVSHVNALTNDWMLPFIVSVACVNGDFTYPVCFAEAWLRATHLGAPTGAVGMYASSINQYWNPPMCGQDEICRLLCDEVMSSYGGLCFNGSCQMMDEYGGDGVDMFKTWNVFGDPSLTVRTANPIALDVTHDEALPPDSETFTVTVNDADGALCGLSYQGTWLGAAVVAGGVATVSIEAPLPAVGEDVVVTVTGTNAIPYVSSTVVGSLAIPLMAVDPDHFEIEVPMGGTATEYLTISDVGEPESILTWTLEIQGGGLTPWLRCNPMSGDTPFGEDSIVDLDIRTGFLATGTYYKELWITTNASEEAVIIPVLLGVGQTPVAVDDAPAVTTLALGPNEPNPFRGATSFRFDLPVPSEVVLEVFDVLGRRVAVPLRGTLEGGSHVVNWSADDVAGHRLSPGVYYYRLRTPSTVELTRQLVIMR